MAPIYTELEASLQEAEHLLYFAPEQRRRAVTDEIQRCFLRLDQQWGDFLLRRQVFREEYLEAAQRLRDVTEHMELIQTARTTCSAEANRIDLEKLLRLWKAIRASHENLHTSFQVFVEACPGADRL